MEKEEVVGFIQKQYHDGKDLHSAYVKSNYPSVFYAAQKHFGSWTKAVKSSDIPQKDVVSRTKWTKEEVIAKLQGLEKEDLVDKNLRTKHASLYRACIKLFGSRKQVMLAANLDYEATLQNVPWTRERIISTIQLLYMKNVPLNFKNINTYHTTLRKRAEKIFGSWGEAVTSAGINYEEIKKNKGRATPSLGEDGILYESQIEGIIANKLYDLKKKDRIIDYESQTGITPGRKWTCDFSVILLNGATLMLEVDPNGKIADTEQEKLNFYDHANVLHYVLRSAKNVENIIERLTNWYSIPIKNTVITAHKTPDGDALASSVAIYDFLISKNKQAVLRFSGEIPKNLEWIIGDRETVKKIPDWVENIVVLDCAPTQSRLGWDLPDGVPIFNIDHHANRLEYNDPDNDIHIIKSCSTASLLFNYFGIRNDILSVGVYTDTMFTKSFTEVYYFLLQLNIDEEKISEYISRINANPDRKLWKMFNESNIHRCRNGFIIVETKESAPDIIESFMQILSKMSESVCLIFGPESIVKLRTSNPLLDVSTIASEFFGGGHPFAAMADAKNRVPELKSTIISYDVPKIPQNDGYGESSDKSEK